MAWRKWLVRAVVFSVVAAAAGVAWLFQLWTNPESVRAQVIQKMQEMFPGAVVTLDSARWRLMGGIYLKDLRLARRDDPERRDFAHFQYATLHHDKEMLSQGQLVIRRIELDRPRLRLVRESDGRWNFIGLFKPSPGQPILPTVVIHAGTILLEDRRPGGTAPAVELSDINLTLLNNPASVITVEANGKSDLASKVQFRATWQRQAKELTLNCAVEGLPIHAELLRRFSGYLPPAMADGLAVSGTASAEAELYFRFDGPSTPHYKVRTALAQGRLNHPRIPLELEQVQTQVFCEDGRVKVEKLTARSGPAKIEASGETRLPHPEKDFEVSLSVDQLTVNKKLLDRLPESFHKIEEWFQPTGRATLAFNCKCQDGQYTHKHCFIRPQEMQASFKNFRYPIDAIRGQLDYDLLRSALVLDLEAKLSNQPMTVKGTWTGQGDQTDADVRIQGTKVPLDEQLLSALPPEHQAVARSFYATGLTDFDIHVRRQPGQPFANHYQARFHHAALKWDGFKYPLRQVSGVLDLYPDHWEFHDFEGTNGLGQVRLSGRAQTVPRSEPPPAGTPPAYRFQVAVVGQNIDLNAELYHALQAQPGTLRVWDTFQPAGRVDFRADIDHATGEEKRPVAENIAMFITLRDGTATPQFFRVPFKDVNGQFHYAKNRVQIWNLRAAHKAGSRIDLRYGTVDLLPGAGYYAHLQGFQADPLVVDDEMLEAMPEPGRKALQALHLKEQPLHIQTKLVVAQEGKAGQPPDVYWDGECKLKDARVNLGLMVENVTGRVACLGRHDGHQFRGVAGNVAWQTAEVLKQPFHDVQSHFQIHLQHPETVLLELKAPLFGGEVSGQGRVDLGPNLRYDLNLTGTQIRLEEFAQHNLKEQAQWKGQAEARLHVFGRANAADTLEGNGSIDVRSGKLYNLPFLLDLLKFLGFRWPDRTMFEEAHAVFALQGKRVRVNRLDLLGNVISFWGRGEINADGSDVQLDFYPTWGRVDQLLPPVLRNIPPAISKTLIKIEARGRLSSNSDDLQFHQRLVPPLFDPLLSLGDRWGGAERGQK